MDVFDDLTPLAANRLRSSIFGVFAQPYRDRLYDMGYARNSIRKYLYGLSHFAYWATQQKFELADLKRSITCFVNQHLQRCRCVDPVQRSRESTQTALGHLVNLLIGSGIRLNTEPSQTDEQLQRFDFHLRQTKGLASSTCSCTVGIVRPLVSMTESGLPTANQLRQFLRQRLSSVSVASAGNTVKAVRNYLRFCAFQGGCVDHLLPIVVSPANWRLAPQPQTLTALEVQRLLDAFPPDLPSRLRCFAIVRCAVDLGLRRSEIIALELDDIDWTAGTVCISKNKSRRIDVLPLPHATGNAIAEYIRLERPRTSSRRIFVRHRTPVDVPVTANVVNQTVLEAYQRAGLPYTRVHILRHTLANRLLNTGGTLKEVADVLRHRELNTSLIYSKVDFTRLSAVAMPWPGRQT